MTALELLAWYATAIAGLLIFLHEKGLVRTTW